MLKPTHSSPRAGYIDRGLHFLERGVQIAGAVKGAYDTAMQIAPYVAPLFAA